jgi:hypothetical protein
MKIQSPNDLAVLRTALMLLTIAFYCFPAQAQTPIPSPSPAPPPITKTGSILVNSPSTVGRITKWVGSSNNGIGTIGDSVITESSLGTIGIGTNPFSDYKLGVGGGISALGAINTSAQYNIGGSRVLGTAGINNVLVGNGAGQNNTANDSSFFGFAAGQANTDGIRNSFFGSNAGRVNITGGDNGFFGASQAHTTRRAAITPFSDSQLAKTTQRANITISSGQTPAYPTVRVATTHSSEHSLAEITRLRAITLSSGT